MQRSGEFSAQLPLCLLLVATLLFASCAQESYAQQETQRAPRQKSTAGGQASSSQAQCGSLSDIARRVEVCAQPLMDILEGTVEKWPRTDEDGQALCNTFGGSERCIRDTARKCGKGIQKTIISTLANSIQRVRKRECSKAKLPAIVKLTRCIEDHQGLIQDWMRNVTGRLNVIEVQIPEDKKLNALCCIVNDIGTEVRGNLQPFCPEEAAFSVRLYRTVLEDVLELICRSPKCNGYLSGYKVPKAKEFSGLISTLLKIVFSLDF